MCFKFLEECKTGIVEGLKQRILDEIEASQKLIEGLKKSKCKE